MKLISDTESLPSPRWIIDDVPVEGLRYIVPISLEGYHEGFNSMIVDLYRRALMVATGHDPKDCWVFDKRVRQFSRALHYGIHGRPFR